MDAIHYKSATDLAGLIAAKEISARELLDHYLMRIDRFDPALNAFVWFDRDGARARADQADQAQARGESWGPLHGVPMSVKESFNMPGSPTTWGRPEFKDNITDDTAVLMQKMMAVGVVPFAKTNVPFNLADWQSFNAIYGTTNNPWDVTRTPGGSSGGSAAALAAGLTGIEAGSDIGASIRNPAHYCGVYGHKPTHEIVSGRGQSLPGNFSKPDIADVGPLARSAEDLAVSLLATAGPDRPDDAGWRLDLPRPHQGALKDFRVAVMLDDPIAEVDGEYGDRLQATVDRLAKTGMTISDRAAPDIDTSRAFEVYLLLLRAATSRGQNDAEVENFARVKDGLDPDDRTYLARMARGITMPHREWLTLDNERQVLRQKWAEFFEEWDLLLCPAAASAAWPHDQEGERHNRTITVNNKQVPTTDQLWWAGIAGMVYLPGTVAPIGLTRTGLPVGIQAIAGHLQDLTSIEFARLLAQEIGGFQPPPGYD